MCHDSLSQDTDALRSFFKALDLVIKDHPNYDWAHANLADFFLRRNEHEKAFQLAAEAAKRNPASARNCFLTAKALVRRKARVEPALAGTRRGAGFANGGSALLAGADLSEARPRGGGGPDAGSIPGGE